MALLCRPRRLPFFLVAAAALAMALFYLLLSLAPCAVSGSAPCYRGYRSAFSFDAARGALQPAWMARLPDAAALVALSIPGTHDTMTYDIGSEVLQCQNWNLSAQLRAGVRYVDIRARLRDDDLHIYHADGDTGFAYADVLRDIAGFLDENPSETVVMRLKDEAPPLGRNTISFEDAFNKHHHPPAPDTPSLYDPSSSSSSQKPVPIPTLGALRSKVFLLQEFAAASGPYGLPWAGPRMALEDDWVVPDVAHLRDKWAAVRDALERAAAAGRDPADKDLLFLAHVSASVGVLPIEAAAGPRNGSVQGLNDATGRWLREAGGADDAVARTGIVILDFPGRELVDAVLSWNGPFWKG